MPRSYKHIKNYEKEILELKDNGLTHQEIGKRLGFTKEQIKGLVKRNNKAQRKIAAGIKIMPKGRPRKNGAELPPSVQQLSQLSQLKYELAVKERKIKRLEMENELMRDFLLLTGRK